MERCMTTLEQEIIENFHKLDGAAQQRVLKQLHASATVPAFDFTAWQARVVVLGTHVAPGPHAVDVLQAIRTGHTSA